MHNQTRQKCYQGNNQNANIVMTFFMLNLGKRFPVKCNNHWTIICREYKNNTFPLSAKLANFCIPGKNDTLPGCKESQFRALTSAEKNLKSRIGRSFLYFEFPKRLKLPVGQVNTQNSLALTNLLAQGCWTWLSLHAAYVTCGHFFRSQHTSKLISIGWIVCKHVALVGIWSIYV